jgi:hypothetical protein
MKYVTVRLKMPKVLYEQLKLQAAQEHKTFSQIVNQKLRQSFSHQQSLKLPLTRLYQEENTKN